MPRRSRGSPATHARPSYGPELVYVKHCAGDKVDLVMLAHHPAAKNTHQQKHVYTLTVTHSLYTQQSHALFLLSLSLFLPHINARTSEGLMYVRALSKQSYGCYMLQLLPDGVREDILRLLFHWHNLHPPVRPRDGERERGEAG